MSCTVVCMPDTSFRWRLDLSISWTSIVKFWNTKELPDKFVQCHKIFEFAHIETHTHTHTHTCLQTHTHAHTRMHTHIKERTFCSLAQESPLLFLHYLWHNKQRKRRAKSPSFWKWVRLVDLSWLSHSMLCKNAPAVCFKKLIIGHWVSLLASTVLLPICSASSPPFSPFSFLLTLYKICSFCTWSLLICMLTTRSLSKRELITFVWINFLKRMSQKSYHFVSVSWHPWNLILFIVVVLSLCAGEPKGCLVVQCHVLLASVIYFWGTIVLALPKADHCHLRALSSWVSSWHDPVQSTWCSNPSTDSLTCPELPFLNFQH